MLETRVQELQDRLISKAYLVESGCWEWHAAIGTHGYGVLTFNKQHTLAHRASYKAFVCDIVDDMMVLHTCDNRRCINPEHLFLGTAKDNIHDMINKGRDHMRNQLKLSEDQVQQIRQLCEDGYTNQEIADLINTSAATVSRIKHGLSYFWVQ